MLASGEPDVDIALLRATCECTQGVHIDDPHVQYLFDVLEHDLSPAERVAWLRFVSGRTRLTPPAMMAEKYKHLTIKPLSKAENAMRDSRNAAAAHGTRSSSGSASGASSRGGASDGGADGGVDTSQDGFLPESHTCFFYLDLPRYSSRDVMLERMRYAIATCRSIDNDATPASETGAFPVVDDVHPNAVQLGGWGSSVLHRQDPFAATIGRPATDPQVRHPTAGGVENVPTPHRRGLSRRPGGGSAGDLGSIPPDSAVGRLRAQERARRLPAETPGPSASQSRRVRRTLSGGLP